MVFRLAVIAAIAVASATVARAQEPEPDPEPDPDLAEIEEALVEDARPAPSAAALLAPDISFVLDVAAAWFSDDTNLQTGEHDPHDRGFTLQQVEMTVGKAVDPYFRFDAAIILGAEGVEIEEAYGTTLALPHSLQVRWGEMFTRFGRLNSTHPHAWDFVDQPFAIGRIFGGDGNHGTGVEVSYLTPLPWFVEIVATATDPFGEGTARSFLGAEEGGFDSPLDVQGTTAIKQFFELGPDWSLLWGLSWATGPNPSAERSDVLGTDLYLKWRPISRASYQSVALQSEWMYRRRGAPGGALADLTGYAYGAWRFARRWSTAARWEYGSAADDGGAGLGDDLDPAWTDDRQRVSANLTFWPTEFSRLRAQGSVDLPAWADPIWAAFLAVEISVGAHAAHKF